MDRQPSGEVRAVDPARSLDLDGRHARVLGLDDEIDLGSVPGTVMPERDGCLRPFGLLDDLVDRERLREVPVLGQGGRVRGVETLCGHTEQVSGQPGVNQVHL